MKKEKNRPDRIILGEIRDAVSCHPGAQPAFRYNLRNFEEVVVMDLAQELKKGQRRLELPSLFESNSRD